MEKSYLNRAFVAGKRFFFLAAFLSASIMSFGQEVNFALASNGASATASSGTAEAAIDGNEGTRWESAQTDDETWTLDMGQARTFNTVKILWEGAYAKQFTISYSSDGENWTPWYAETNLTKSGWQTIYVAPDVTAQYIQYHGTQRATVWGQSFFEFQVFQGEAPRVYTPVESMNIIASSGGYNDPARVLDGNMGTEWQGSASNGTAGDEASRTFDAWFVIDLDQYYTIEKIAISFEGACSQEYHVDFSTNNADWMTGYNYVGEAGVHGYTAELTELDNATKVRYIRFWSTKAATEWGMKIWEFEVFGVPFVSDDTEAPVMVSAELVSASSVSAVIAVAATDNDEVAKYHVADAANGIDMYCTAAEGQITVGGLTPETSYNFTVTALDVAQNESANSLTVPVTTPARALVPATAAPVPAWPAAQVKSLYSDAYPFAPASLNSYNEGWWNNPEMAEENVDGDHYLHYTLNRDGMIGAQFAETSVALMEKMHIDVYASKAGTVTFRFITAGDPDAVNNTRKTLTLEAEKWNSFDFDLADFGAHNWQKLFQFSIENYNAGGLVGEHISVDNIYLYRTTAIDDTEAPTNLAGSVTAFSYFTVTLALSAQDDLGVVNFIVKNGEETLATAGGASGATVNVVVPDLLPNTDYNLTVIAKDENGNEAAPIVVAAKTAEAPAPAPAPDFTGKTNITPIFCDALEGGPAINIGGWGQSTIAMVAQLAEGDHVYYLTNMNYLGWEFGTDVDASGADKLHADFYATDMTSVQLTPISRGPIEGVYTVNLASGEWTGVDIPLSAYPANINYGELFQFKFMEAAPAGKDLFIDNVYFYKAVGAGIDHVQGDNAQCAKVIENGVLYLIHKGTKYNVQGVRVQ